MSEGKPIRIGKAATEFNVSMQKIVEFLAKEGHAVSGMNAKLTPQQYELLDNKYGVDKKVKQKADEIEFVGLKGDKPDSGVKPDTEPQVVKVVEPDDNTSGRDLFIAQSSIKSPEEKTKAPEPKVINKIDPQDVPAPKVEAKVEAPKEVEEKKIERKTEDAAVEEAVPAPKPTIEPVAPVVEKKPDVEPQAEAELPKEVESPKKVEPVKKEEKKKDVPLEEPKKEEPKPLEQNAPKIEETAKTVVENDVIPEGKDKAPIITAPEQIAKPIDAPVLPENKSIEKEQTANGPRVLGTIDLDSLNQKTKPARKSKKEKQKSRTEKRKDSTNNATTASGQQNKANEKKPMQPVAKKTPEKIPAPDKKIVVPQKPEDENFMPTEVQKLAGPKILDKIVLPEKKKPEKKKPVASSSGDMNKTRKKKRKRIKPAGTPVNKDQQGQRPQGQRPQGQSGTGTQQSRDGQQNDRRGRAKARPRKKELPKVEPTPEEIQQKVRETLTKLTSHSKSKGAKHRRAKRDQASQVRQEEMIRQEEEKKVLKATEFVTANELATMMNVPVNSIISACMSLGLFVSINQRLDAETITVVAEEFGYSVEFVSVEVLEAIDEMEDVSDDDDENRIPRAPIVTVMGHVDHGKTKLLDFIRSANVVAGEAGGITQHIGAYEVTLKNDKKITFLDTPGHEAFTAMRARGAQVTDIAIIVIAADDSVMPQTKEAINHAQAAGVPIVFALNKIDKPTANVERLKEQLAQMNYLVEDWGGKYQSQEISAKEGINVDELLEKVLLEAELLDLKANPERLAKGTIIESSLDKGRGYVSKMLVQNGTMHIGDTVLAGAYYGKVKAMYNQFNEPVEEAGPSFPVLMLGLNGAPGAGDTFNVMKEEREAKNIATKRLQLQREQGLRTQKHITLDEIGRRIAIGDFKELNVIVKGDVQGSIEALTDAILKLSTEEVQVNVVHQAVGQIVESDVLLASASNAVIIGFQVRPSVQARRLAEAEQIDIRLYSIIYKALDELKSAIEGLLAPKIEEKILGNVEVREIFKITKVGTIAGCFVLEGKIHRNTKVRVIRDGIVVYTGLLGSLRRFKDDVKEAIVGQECGLNIENFNDIKVGDIVEGYEEFEIKRSL